MTTSTSGTHVAAPLMEAIGPDAFAEVASWLRYVASEHALEYDGKILSPSVAWLAEAVTFFGGQENQKKEQP